MDFRDEFNRIERIEKEIKKNFPICNYIWDFAFINELINYLDSCEDDPLVTKSKKLMKEKGKDYFYRLFLSRAYKIENLSLDFEGIREVLYHIFNG